MIMYKCDLTTFVLLESTKPPVTGTHHAINGYQTGWASFSSVVSEQDSSTENSIYQGRLVPSTTGQDLVLYF